MIFDELTMILAGQPHDGWGGEGWWWPLWWVLALALLGAAVWLVARRGARGREAGGDRARDILAERFARGELSAEEYRDRLDQLK